MILSKLKSFKPYIYQYLGFGFYSISTLIVSSLLVRSIGDIAYGQIVVIQSSSLIIIQLVLNVIDLNFQRSHLSADYKFFVKQKVFFLLFAFPVYILYTAAKIDLNIIPLTLLLLFGLGSAFQSLVFLSIAYNSAKNLDRLSIAQRLIPQISIALFVLTAWQGLSSVQVYCFSYFLSWFLMAIVSYKSHFPRLSFNIDLSLSKLEVYWSSMAKSFPLILSMVGTLFYGTIDILFFSSQVSPEVITYFKIIYSLIFSCSPLISATCFVMLSRLTLLESTHYKPSVRPLIRLMFKNILLTVAVCIAWCCLVYALVPLVLTAIYRLEYNYEVNLSVSLLLVTFTINSISSILSYCLISLKRDKLVTASILIGGLAYIALLSLCSSSFALGLLSFSEMSMFGNILTFLALSISFCFAVNGRSISKAAQTL